MSALILTGSSNRQLPAENAELTRSLMDPSPSWDEGTVIEVDGPVPDPHGEQAWVGSSGEHTGRDEHGDDEGHQQFGLSVTTQPPDVPGSDSDEKPPYVPTTTTSYGQNGDSEFTKNGIKSISHSGQYHGSWPGDSPLLTSERSRASGTTKRNLSPASRFRRKQRLKSKLILVVLVIFLLALVALCGGIIGRLLSCSTQLLRSQVNNNISEVNHLFKKSQTKVSKPLFSHDNGHIYPLSFYEDIDLTERQPTEGMNTEHPRQKIVRLPDIFLPKSIHYDLNFTFLTEHQFMGSVALQFRLKVASRQIQLHYSPNLYYHSQSIKLFVLNQSDTRGPDQYARPSEKLPIEILELLPPNRTRHILTIVPAKELSSVNTTYLIEISYTSPLCTNQAIHCDFTSASVSPSLSAFATKLEPIDARELFPCLDEPALKATFSISLTLDPSTFLGNAQERPAPTNENSARRQNITILSNEALCEELPASLDNIPIIDRQTNGDPSHDGASEYLHHHHLKRQLSGEQQEKAKGQKLVTYRFCKTPLMSTYLVAFSIGHFSSGCVHSRDANVPICVHVPASFADASLDFVLGSGLQAI